jgi:hypothetical protein
VVEMKETIAEEALALAAAVGTTVVAPLMHARMNVASMVT